MGLISGLLDSANSYLSLFVFGVLIILGVWSGLAIQTKRWHDRGKSGAMNLIGIIPYIGGIWTFIECGCLRGTEGTNEYGDDPT